MVTKTAHRHLEDLALRKLADRTKTSSSDNAPDLVSQRLATQVLAGAGRE
jgi:hypothetical protein